MGTGPPQNPQNFFPRLICFFLGKLDFWWFMKLVFVFTNYNIFTLFINIGDELDPRAAAVEFISRSQP